MYNTSFPVKYNDIEKELVNMLPSEDVEHEDIIRVCTELYRQEVAYVFGLEDVGIEENVMYTNICAICVTMSENKQFDQCIQRVIREYVTNNQRLEETFTKYIWVACFSQQVFYIMHACIVEQLTTNSISENTLSTLYDLLVTQVVGTTD